MSEKQKQSYQGINSQNDLWEDYLNEKEEKKEPSKPQISHRVEEDLLNFQKESRLTTRHNSRSSLLAMIPIGLLVLVVVMFMAFRSYNNNHYDVIINDEPIEIEEIEDEYFIVDDTDILKTPTFSIEGNYHTLPVKVYELLDSNDWYIANDAFGADINEVGEEPVQAILKDSYGQKMADVLVVSGGGVVPLKEATVIALSIDSNSYIDLDAYVSHYYEGDYVGDVLDEANIAYEKIGDGDKLQYIINQKVDNGTDYNNYQLQYNIENDLVTNITMILGK